MKRGIIAIVTIANMASIENRYQKAPINNAICNILRYSHHSILARLEAGIASINDGMWNIEIMFHA